jgi:hypothetical protein
MSGRRACDLFTENDPTFRKVIWRHFNVDAVADDRPDAVTAHLAGRIRNDAAIVVEQHAEPTVRKNLVNDTFDCKQFFFRHERIILVRRNDPERSARG